MTGTSKVPVIFFEVLVYVSPIPNIVSSRSIEEARTTKWITSP